MSSTHLDSNFHSHDSSKTLSAAASEGSGSVMEKGTATPPSRDDEKLVGPQVVPAPAPEGPPDGGYGWFIVVCQFFINCEFSPFLRRLSPLIEMSQLQPGVMQVHTAYFYRSIAKRIVSYIWRLLYFTRTDCD